MLYSAADAPEVAVSGWPAIIILVGSVSTAAVAVVAFFRKVAFPLADLVAEIRRDFPVWSDIAQQFGEAGQETISRELRALAANDEVSAANQQIILDRLDNVIATTDSLDRKLSDTRHNIIGDYAALGIGATAASNLVDAIERTASRLQDVQSRLQTLEQRLPPEEP